MKTLVVRASRRLLLHHPWQLVLALFGIIVGVAVVVAMELAKHSALVSFERATTALFGRATHRITAPEGIPETLYCKLRYHGFVASRPLVEGMLRTADGNGLKLLGIDPLAEQHFAPAWLAGTESFDGTVWSRLVLEPDTVLMSTQAAAKLGLSSGDRFAVFVAGRQRWLTLIGIFDPVRDEAVLGPLLIADIATAQEVLDLLGRLSAIDLIVDGRRPLAELRQHLSPNVELAARSAGSVSVKRMTWSFYINLTALSLLSLLVGAFLIYNTISFMVVQRRRLFAIMRMLGLTRREILAEVLGEALILGLVGSLAGMLIGSMLGWFLLSLLARTLDDVYFSLPAAELTLSPWLLAKGGMLGLGATLAAAMVPALEASRTRPVTITARSLQEGRSRRCSVWLGILGVALLLAAALLLRWSDSLISGFIALTLAVIGCALLIPVSIPATMGLCQWLGGSLFGPLGRMPVRSVSASLSRTGVAAAALMVAVATTIGMILMIHSFRDSVRHWLEQRLDADLYVYIESNAGRPPLPYGFGERIIALPGVADAGGVRYLRHATEAGFIRINAYHLSPSAFATFDLLERAAGDDPWQAFKQGKVMVSEAFANLRGIHAGDPVVLPTPEGPRTFRIFAVFVDYNAGQGLIAMDYEVYRRFWHDDSISTFWVYLRPGADSGEVAERIRALLPQQPLEVTDHRALLHLSMAVFDQAFAVTGVLRWLATGIAFIGVFSALLALQLERSREFGVLRALGLTPLQLWLQVIAETTLLGSMAGCMAIPVGMLMGWMLMEVINHRAFGWTLELSLQHGDLLQGLTLALVAALLAGLYPAWKMAQTSPAEALRCE